MAFKQRMNDNVVSYGSIARSPDPITSSPSPTRSILILPVAVLAAGFFLIRFGSGVRTMNEITSSLDATMKMPSHFELSLEDYLDDKQKDKNEGNSTNVCDSPFGYEEEERQRLITCFGEYNIVVASYDSNVKFAYQVLATVTEITGDHAHMPSGKSRFADGFHFYVQAQSGNCEKNVPTPLCKLLECSATHPARVGAFIHEAVTYPDQPAVHFRFMHSPKCVEQYEGMCIDKKEGGSGSGAGMQLYCTTHNQSTALLTVGGGGGGGAGPGLSFGNGGGAGMQILLADSTTACTEGGYGTHFHVKNITCPKKRTLRGNITKGKQGSAKDDGSFAIDNACKRSKFVSGVDVVRAAAAACIQDPSSELSVSAGGGSGGGVNDNERLLYRFSTGFSFRFGPVPIALQSSDKRGISSKTRGNKADFDFQVKCSHAYADAVCANAGYLKHAKTSYALCSCPVVEMYDPPSYNYSCSYSLSKTSDEAVSVALLTQNCETWCPEKNAVTLNSGEACPVLLPACSCKVTVSNSSLSISPSPSISPSALLSNASTADVWIPDTVVQGDNAATGEFPSLVPSMPGSSLPSAVPSSSAQSPLPSSVPGVIPSLSPRRSPSSAQSNAASTLPSSRPGEVPSEIPSASPSSSPSSAQSNAPSTLPSSAPSVVPSASPSSSPSSVQSNGPSPLPISAPSVVPSTSPSISPSSAQSNAPSTLPSSPPSVTPKTVPTRSPSLLQRRTPRELPSSAPNVVLSAAAH